MAVGSPFTVRWDAARRGMPERSAHSRRAAYDDEARPFRWTYDATPLKAA
ncbi:hypothetical protein [Streptomyces sp. NPDC059092]